MEGEEELSSESEMEELQGIIDFQEDIYNLTYIKMLNSDSPVIHRELTLKSFLTSMIQCLLISLILTERNGF